MKILWVKTDFLHPTTRGGQIRTLEMVRRLHTRHELHYLAFDDPDNREGLRRAGEYSAKQYTVSHMAPARGSLAFAGQVAKGLVSSLPVAVSRWTSPAMRRRISELMRAENFDAVVCDFLAPAANFEDPSQYVLFQHNVETVIWQRHAQNASGPLRKAYFGLQAKRMFQFEHKVCRAASSVVAVSEADANTMGQCSASPACLPSLPALTWNTFRRGRPVWNPLPIWCSSVRWTGCRTPMECCGSSARFCLSFEQKSLAVRLRSWAGSLDRRSAH